MKIPYKTDGESQFTAAITTQEERERERLREGKERVDERRETTERREVKGEGRSLMEGTMEEKKKHEKGKEMERRDRQGGD